MKYTTQEVTGCWDCPFRQDGYPHKVGDTCGLDTEDREIEESLPSWCSLKEETITIVLKNN